MPGWEPGRAWHLHHRRKRCTQLTAQPDGTRTWREQSEQGVAWGPARGPARPQGKPSAQIVGEDGNPGQGGKGLPDLLAEMGQGRAGFA